MVDCGKTPLSILRKLHCRPITALYCVNLFYGDTRKLTYRTVLVLQYLKKLLALALQIHLFGSIGIGNIFFNYC